MNPPLPPSAGRPSWFAPESPARFARLAVAAMLAASGPRAAPASSPFRQVEPVPLADVQWTGGFWKDRFDSCRKTMIPSMWGIMRGTDHKPFLEHFRIAAGLAEGDYHGAKWNDGDFYKWMEAVCAVLAQAPDPEWEQTLDEIIEVIARAQRPDGYLHTPVLVAARNGDPAAEPFADPFNFEMYNMGHLMTTACLHHRVTGKENLLAVARKAADFLDAWFRSPSPDQARHAVCPSHYMGLVDLHRTTGEARYLDLAMRLFAMRSLVRDGGDDNQDRVPFPDQSEAVGHAVRANYLHAGAADLFAETGDPSLWPSLDALWHNVVGKKMHVTGGCGALYDGASPDGSSRQGEITRVHQAYGRNYQLPNTTAHNETCANIGNVLWNWRMFLASGEGRFVDVAELALHNSVLSGVGLNGTEFFYTNPLRQVDPPPLELRWPRTRVRFMTSFCCPPNLVRTIAGLAGLAYGRSEATLWVNLYGSSTVSTTLPDTTRVTLDQTTNYPWDGAIRFTIRECGDAPLRINLRIPGWASQASVSIDGEPAVDAIPGPNGYASLSHDWRPGTFIDLLLEMPPHLVEAHPLVEESANHVAIRRGPVVYCLESPDLPEDVRVADMRIPGDVELRARFAPDLLGGVAVVEALVVARSSGDWAGRLYREFKPAASRPVPATFIPYFAWANRGRSEMSVWLPLD